MNKTLRGALRKIARPWWWSAELIAAALPMTEHTQDTIPSVKECGTRRHWVVAIMYVSVLYAIIYAMTLFHVASWLLLNPITTVGNILSDLTGSPWPTFISGLVMIVLMAFYLTFFFGRRSVPAMTQQRDQSEQGQAPREGETLAEQPQQSTPSQKQFHKSFMETWILSEEQGFREGAENWTWPERVRACFLFGLMHILNLFFPYVVVLMLTVGGGVFMHEYLRVMKKTGSRQAALGASTALHHHYNIASFFGLPVYIGLLIATVVIRGI